MACALCHDVGKPFEFDPQNQERWAQNPAAAGFPAIRHTQYGTYVRMTIGLPEEVCHAAGSHSGEGVSSYSDRCTSPSCTTPTTRSGRR